tara:strand:+ start:234 stop:431 length:198 start_codon:yes stop_codon:yes gene_type:complete
METIELDQKIRTKNLELSKALQDVDRLISENVELNDEIVRLKEEKNPIQFNKVEVVDIYDRNLNC